MVTKLVSSSLTTSNAIGDAESGVSIAGKREAGEGSEALSNSLHPFEVAYMILRHRTLPLRDFGKQRRSLNSQQVAQVRAHARKQLILTQVKHFWL